MKNVKIRSILIRFLGLTGIWLVSSSPLAAAAPNPAASVLIIYNDDSCAIQPTYNGNGAVFLQQTLEAANPAPSVSLWEVPCSMTAATGVLTGELNPASPLNPPVAGLETTMTQAMLNSYCEVWDMRFDENNQNVSCNTLESDMITTGAGTSDTAFYTNYLTQGGNLWLNMDNAGFCERDTSVVNFISSAIGCSLPYSAIGTIQTAGFDWTTFNNAGPYNFATNDNTLTNFYTDWPGFIPSSAICGGTPLTTDSTGVSVMEVAWKPSIGGTLELSMDTNANSEFGYRTGSDGTSNAQYYQNVYTNLANCSKSPTNTPTVTPTPTITGIPTNTPTLTPIFSFTQTNSPTITVTATVTPTTTNGIIFQKQASSSQVEGGQTFDYTVSLSISGNSLLGGVVSDVLPAGVTFVSVVNSPPGATFNQSGQNLQWTLPTLSAGTYQFIYQVEVANLINNSNALVNNAQLTAPSIPTKTASASVTVIGPYTVRVGVYNAAGELVKQILVQDFSQPINAITLSPGNTITTLNGPDNVIYIYSGTNLIGSWNGSNQAGDPVSNGVYNLKIDTFTSFGSETSVTQQILVSRKLAEVTLDVYNSAGEIVKHLYTYADDPNGAEMTAMNLSSAVLEPGTASVAGQPTNVQIVLQTTGFPVTLTWDGTNDNGALVSAGVYELQAYWQDGTGGITDIVKEIIVAAGGEFNNKITVEPNVLNLTTGKTTTTFLINSSNPTTLKVLIYTIAGELVRGVTGTPGSNMVVWDAGSMASGLYIAVVEVVGPTGNVTQRQISKISVIH